AIGKGTTYILPYRYGSEPIVYKPITAKVSDTPLRLTVPGHGLTDGWPVALTDTGWPQLSAKTWPPCATDNLRATVVDADTIEFNTIDAKRLTGDYAAGGVLAYLTPVSLAGASASFDVYP